MSKSTTEVSGQSFSQSVSQSVKHLTTWPLKRLIYEVVIITTTTTSAHSNFWMFSGDFGYFKPLFPTDRLCAQLQKWWCTKLHQVSLELLLLLLFGFTFLFSFSSFFPFFSNPGFCLYVVLWCACQRVWWQLFRCDARDAATAAVAAAVAAKPKLNWTELVKPQKVVLQSAATMLQQQQQKKNNHSSGSNKTTQFSALHE